MKNQRFDITMSLVTCSRIIPRPWLSLLRQAASPPRLNGRGLFSSLQKPPNVVSFRFLSSYQSKDNPHWRDSGWPISDNALLILGFSLLGGTLLYVSMRDVLFVLCLALLLGSYDARVSMGGLFL